MEYKVNGFTVKFDRDKCLEALKDLSINEEDLKAYQEGEECYFQKLWTEDNVSYTEYKSDQDKLEYYINTLDVDTMEVLVSEIGRKKNGGFRKGAVTYAYTPQHMSQFDYEYCNSWYTPTVKVKALDECTCEIFVTSEYFKC